MLISRARAGFISLLLTIGFVSNASFATELGILPPDLDYQKVCIKQPEIQVKEFDWNKHTPATSGLTELEILNLARFYYEGTAIIVPDYDRARTLVEYLIANGEDTRNDALFMQFDMYRYGHGYTQSPAMAKKIIIEMTRNAGLPKAFSLYGSMLAAEGEYTRAAENFRRAFVGGYSRASLNLAYLYHDKKIPASDEDVDRIIAQARDSILRDLNKGACMNLTTMGAMYGRLNNIPKAEYYSAKWFEKAAALDDAEAKMELAAIVQRGYVLPYDEARILKLWREAAALGSDRAMLLLGEYSLLNHKNDEDLKTAEDWLRKSAVRHNVKAMELLAALYDGRYPAMANEKQQRRWLEEALGYPGVKDKSIMQLAELYESDGKVPAEKIFDLYQKAAAKGNNQAYLKMGDAYRYGLGTEASPVYALRYYRIAASNGDTSAMEAMEQAYVCGMGVDKNPEQAGFWKQQVDYYDSVAVLDGAYKLLLSENQGGWAEVERNLMLLAITRKNLEAMVLLGLLFDKAGEREKSEEWLNRALSADEKSKTDYEAHVLLGEIRLEGPADQDIATGLSLLEKAAQAGNADAKDILGKWYKNHGDMAKAKKYFLEASAAGKSSALVKLAEIEIDQGAGSAAIAYLEKAAGYHDIGAMLKLASGYEEKGWIKSPDPVKSRAWFDRALKNYPCKTSDMIAISRAYNEGLYGLEKDPAGAERWIMRIGDLDPGDDKNALNIAKSILFSDLAKDPAKKEKAYGLLEKLADKGHAEASSILAGLYLDRSSTAYDPDKAMAWVIKSAENGDIDAMLELANMYMSGYGVPASVDTARSWLEKAAASGNAEAVQRLKNMKAVQ